MILINIELAIRYKDHYCKLRDAIDNFIDNVEICRRAKKETVDTKREVTAKKIRLASTFNETSVSDAFGDSVNWL